MNRSFAMLVVVVLCVCGSARADVVTFFNSSQVATEVSLGVNEDTISSNGYLFTYTRDKLFTGGVGLTEPIGRTVRVPWPEGIEAQAVTTGPNVGKAKIVIERVDGEPFDLVAFTARLLANTGGAGAAIEIMPLFNGEDGLPDPAMFDATGYYGMEVSYSTTPGIYGQNTSQLVGFHSYVATLYVDYAFTALTLVGPPVPPTAVPGDFDGSGIVDTQDINPFIMALTDPAGYETAYGVAPGLYDLNGDGLINTEDINPFVAVLTGAGAAAVVPEPAGLSLLAMGVVVITRRRR